LNQVHNLSQETHFNQTPLLDGAFEMTLFTVEEGEEQSVQITLNSSSPVALGFGRDLQEIIQNWRTAPSGNTFGVIQKKKLDIVDDAQGSVADIRASLQPLQDRFEQAVAKLKLLSDKTREARGRIHDTEMASEVTALTKKTLLAQSKISLQAQANQQPQVAMRLLE
jgi:flagellin-like hook-associated protein FlgL